MKVLITGNGGSGKSAVCEDLKQRGYNAIDADNGGIARWEDATTGQPVEVDYRHFVDYSLVAWNWHRDKMRALVEGDKDAFVCGSASNQFAFYPLFDRVFVLNPSPGVHRNRLATRQSDYGKDSRTMEWIIADQKEVVEASRKLGAIIINADGTVTETVAEILSRTYGH